MSVLVVGGAGYIGSHTVRYLQEKGIDVIVVDNLSTGHRDSIKVDNFYKVDCRDEASLDKVFKNHKIEGVIHFAALSLVGISMEKPYEYYDNNVNGAICLLNVMSKNNVKKIVFSSTAAVYGEPENSPIIEDSITNPTNPYGETKLAMEKMMKWFDRAYGVKYVALRYFNAAGAWEDGTIGENHNPETHLIPLILQVPLNKRENITIFGDDYPTKDGTCIRDYIHVVDLADAHYLAYEYLVNGDESNTFNLGNGEGYSVKEVVEMARKVTGIQIPEVIGEKRLGDPATLVASSERARKILGWKPKYYKLEKIISDAWNYYNNNSKN